MRELDPFTPLWVALRLPFSFACKPSTTKTLAYVSLGLGTVHVDFAAPSEIYCFAGVLLLHFTTFFLPLFVKPCTPQNLPGFQSVIPANPSARDQGLTKTIGSLRVDLPLFHDQMPRNPEKAMAIWLRSLSAWLMLEACLSFEAFGWSNVEPPLLVMDFVFWVSWQVGGSVA